MKPSVCTGWAWVESSEGWCCSVHLTYGLGEFEDVMQRFHVRGVFNTRVSMDGSVLIEYSGDAWTRLTLIELLEEL